jgi:hypothetical protein
LIITIGEALQRVDVDELHLAAVGQLDQSQSFELRERAADGLDS